MLSFAFVGVWVSPLPGIPRFNQSFLVSLFDDPYTTTVGIGSGNLVVQKMGKPPQPTVAFGPARFQVQHTSIQGAAKTLGVVMKEAGRLTNQQIPLLQAIGLNTEHEWVKPAFKPSDRWLADHYIKKGLTLTLDGTVAEAININFRLRLSSPDRNYNIQLQPRTDNDSALFAAINDHRDWNQAVPDPDTVAKLLNEAVEEINNRVTPIILGGVADD